MSIVVCNNNSLSAITSIPAGISGGSLNLISTQTASSSSTISFTSGIDSTYKEYIFKFYNIHPSGTADDIAFTFNGSADSGSNYNVTKTTTYFNALHAENDSAALLEYVATADLAQSTDFTRLMQNLETTSDESGSGFLHLFDPSSTTFVKHFIASTNFYHNGDYSVNAFPAGYFNTTSAIDAIQFKMTSGNIDSGVIKLYGVS